MSLLIIGMLILGLLLLAVEIFIIPGTTIAGVSGGILLLVGSILSYFEYGIDQGNMILLGSVITSVALFIIGTKTVGGKGMALESNLGASRVKKFDDDKADLRVGDTGVAYGDIRPYGKAIINSKVYDVCSTGGFIDDNCKIRVTEVGKTEIVVEVVV